MSLTNYNVQWFEQNQAALETNDLLYVLRAYIDYCCEFWNDDDNNVLMREVSTEFLEFLLSLYDNDQVIQVRLDQLICKVMYDLIEESVTEYLDAGMEITITFKDFRNSVPDLFPKVVPFEHYLTKILDKYNVPYENRTIFFWQDK